MVDGVGFGKTAVIIGCSSGIGHATTQLFLSHQYQVFGVDIREMDYTKVDERDQERLHFHQADLMKDGECDEAIRICVAEHGYVRSYSLVGQGLSSEDCVLRIGRYREKIDVLANVAGILDASAAADVYTDDEWDKVIGVNLTVPTRMIRAVLPFMKAKRRGSIINISSHAGTSGASAGLAYTTSKHGLVSHAFLILARPKARLPTYSLNGVARSDKTHSMAFSRLGHPLQRNFAWRSSNKPRRVDGEGKLGRRELFTHRVSRCLLELAEKTNNLGKERFMLWLRHRVNRSRCQRQPSPT
jgi:NAD(P)-dependent dehydrogenase (short-subunit alcohol dehydrogenase family)